MQSGNTPANTKTLGDPLGYVFSNEGGLVMEGSRNAESFARQMLADAFDLVRSGWCQGMSAQDEMGRAIEPSSAFARAWSANGALERVWRRTALDVELALEAFERANLALTAAVGDVPARWNDAADCTKERVLDALSRAASLVRPDSEAALDADQLDDIDRYQEIPAFLSEPSS